MQTLLWASGYNVFSDVATIPLICLMLGVCMLVHKAGFYIGKLAKIWKIDETIEKLVDNNNEETIGELFQRVLDPKII